MYQYSSFDYEFVRARAAQFRGQLERWQSGALSDEAFRPLRLQNGWYVQRYAPMLRVAIPYGLVSAAQMRVLARIAEEFDVPSPDLLTRAQATQDLLDTNVGNPLAARLRFGYGHFTTRQNIQFNWIPLDKSADVMDLLASVGMHGIQTSGNCIRNISSDELAGIAPDEIADPRPFCEILRQWSTLHPEFAYLPRKFKIAVIGAEEDRAATLWHDVGLQLRRNSQGELGFRVLAGGGMGRTPIAAVEMRAFLPWQEILNYLEALVRVYNQFGRRDNKYKARIKILIKAEGQVFIDALEAEYRAIVEQDGAAHTISQAELDRIVQRFSAPVRPAAQSTGAATSGQAESTAAKELQSSAKPVAYQRWLERNVAGHRAPELCAVTLPLKRIGLAPGDATPQQMRAAADLADRFSAGEIRVTHKQNLLLPWVRRADLPALWQEVLALNLAQPTHGLLNDIIACPGGDFCDLANARSLPLAAAILERYNDMDELHDLGEIDIHISGCINSCGHHHSGHIGILGVDKDGKEWYQVSLGGSDGSHLSGPTVAGKIVGPSFSANEVPDVLEAVLDCYREKREPGERFINTFKRVGLDAFKMAANAARHPAADSALQPSSSHAEAATA